MVTVIIRFSKSHKYDDCKNFDIKNKRLLVKNLFKYLNINKTNKVKIIGIFLALKIFNILQTLAC